MEPAEAAPAPALHCLSVAAEQPLDLTATLALTEGASRALRMLGRVRGLAREPARLEAELAPALGGPGSAGGACSGRAAACWVQNETGLPLACWLGPSGAAAGAREPGEEFFLRKLFRLKGSASMRAILVWR